MTFSPKNLRKIPIFSRVIVDLDEPCGKLRNFRVHPVISSVGSFLGWFSLIPDGVPDVGQLLVDPLDLSLLALAVADVRDEDGLEEVENKIYMKPKTLQLVKVGYSLTSVAQTSMRTSANIAHLLNDFFY